MAPRVLLGLLLALCCAVNCEAGPASIPPGEAQTFGFLFRAQAIEAPFLNELLSYHLQLGFRTAYIINTEPRREASMRGAVEKGLRDRVVWLPTPPEHNLPDTYMLPLIKEHVTETYVMVHDSDEFLWLPPGYPTIGAWVEDFHSRHASFCWSFRWLNIPNFNPLAQSMLGSLSAGETAILESSEHKSLGRVASITSLSLHTMNCEGGTTHFGSVTAADPLPTTPHFLHFIIRSSSHDMLKVLEQRKMNSPSGTKTGGRINSPENVRAILQAPSDTPAFPLTDYPMRLAYHVVLREAAGAKSLRSTEMMERLNVKPVEHAANLQMLWKQIKTSLRKFDSRGALCLGDLPDFESTELLLKAGEERLDDCLGLSVKLDPEQLLTEETKEAVAHVSENTFHVVQALRNAEKAARH